MKTLKILKRLGAVSLSLAAAAAMAGSGGGNSLKTAAAPTYQDYQNQIAELERQQQELDKQIAGAADDLESEQKKQNAINEKIDAVQKKIDTVEKYSEELEKNIADLDAKVRETQAALETKEKEITSGISDFKSRLRAMYISGSESYTEMLLESKDFYDILMRMELVKRVASHDNDTINGLLELKEQYEKQQEQLKSQQEEMKASLKEYSERLSDLQSQRQELDSLKSQSEQNLASIQQKQTDLQNEKDNVQKKKEQAQYNATTTTTTTTTYIAQTQRSSNGASNKKPVSTTTSPSYSGSNSDKINTVVSYAKGMVGGSYVWGGSSYGATDCSGLVMLSYAQVGISLPHLAASQAGYGISVSYNDMQPGDLIFFGSNYYHVAMYIGGGMMVHAENSSTGIVISYVSSFSQYNPISAIRRLIY